MAEGVPASRLTRPRGGNELYISSEKKNGQHTTHPTAHTRLRTIFLQLLFAMTLSPNEEAAKLAHRKHRGFYPSVT